MRNACRWMWLALFCFTAGIISAEDAPVVPAEKPAAEKPAAPAAAVVPAAKPAPAEKPAYVIPERKSEFYYFRVGKEMQWYTAELARKLNQQFQKRKDDKAMHLALLLDSSTATCNLLEELDKHISDLIKNGPKGLTVSVVALRNQPEVVSRLCVEGKELRRAVRKMKEEAQDAQTRAQVKLNPGQRRQVQAWDMVLMTEDDCIKDWCSGVRFCVKELTKDNPLDAIALFTLDNADTENDVEGLAATLKDAGIAFYAAGPETMLTTGDSLPVYERMQFYSKCKEELKINYGEQFFFHRRESAVNEIIPVAGVDGPMECIGCPTGYGYYGASRLAYATNGVYFIISDKGRPQCACMFHGPGDRLGRGGAAGIRPAPLLGPDGKEKEPVPIKPYEFEPELQDKYEPCLLAREEVIELYQASPYYRYLFTLRGRKLELLKPAKIPNWSWDEGKYHFGAWHVTPWAAADGKPVAVSIQELPPLMIHSGERSAPGVWQHTFKANPQAASGYTHFYTAEGVEIAKKWLDDTIKPLELNIEKIRAEVPLDPPTRWCHRAIAEIEYFILCLENQLFYLKQYRYCLDEMIKDPAVKQLLEATKTEAEARKKLDDFQKNGGAQGVPYIAMKMPRLLKQRCEDYDMAMSKRPPVFGGAEGLASLNRLIKARQDMAQKIKTSTWTNFFKMGWQRQYHWYRIEPGGGGTIVPPPKVPVQPVYAPPSVPPQPTPSAPDY